MSVLRRPVVLMVLGLAFLGWAAVRVAGDGGGGPSEAEKEAAATRCLFPACPTNADPLPARGYENATVVVDPKDAGHMIVVANNLVGATCSWHVTFNRGRDWEDHAFELPAGYRPCGLDSSGLLSAGNVALGPSGTLYAVLSSGPADGTAFDRVLLATSTDGGRSFRPARVAAQPADPETAFVRAQVVAVAGPAGRDQVLLTFIACRPDPSRGDQRACLESWFARSTDGGGTFSPPVLVSEPPGGTTPSRAVVLDDGAIVVTYVRRGYADGTADVVLARSADDGATFRSRRIDNQPGLGQSWDPAKLVADPAGRVLYTVFTDRRTGAPQVYLRRSRDKGGTWEEAVQLLPPGPSGTASASFDPQLSVAPNGRIDVVFYRQAENDTDNVFWMHSTDGGDRFLARQLNDRPINRRNGVGYRNEVGHHYAPGVSSSAGGAVFVWSETRGEDRLTNVQEIVLRKVDLAPP